MNARAILLAAAVASPGALPAQNVDAAKCAEAGIARIAKDLVPR